MYYYNLHQSDLNEILISDLTLSASSSCNEYAVLTDLNVYQVKRVAHKSK